MNGRGKAKFRNGWITCYKCGHKLAKLLENAKADGLEIKCGSCKNLNVIIEENTTESENQIAKPL